MKKETMTKRTTKYQGRVFTIYEDEIVNAHDQPSTREVVMHTGGVGVLPVLGTRVVLVKQYRYVVGEFLLEIPAGKKEIQEDPLACAIRELKEETGYEAKQLQSLGYFYPTPGYDTERIDLFLAKDLTPGKTHFDPEEMLETVTLELNEALRMIDTGDITDAKTIIALLAYERMKHHDL